MIGSSECAFVRLCSRCPFDTWLPAFELHLLRHCHRCPRLLTHPHFPSPWPFFRTCKRLSSLLPTFLFTDHINRQSTSTHAGPGPLGPHVAQQLSECTPPPPRPCLCHEGVHFMQNPRGINFPENPQMSSVVLHEDTLWCALTQLFFAASTMGGCNIHHMSTSLQQQSSKSVGQCNGLQ